jgi:hypothetical protein
LPFPRLSVTSTGRWRESVWCRLARVAATSNPVRVDPRTASAALGDRAHDDHFGPFQVVRSSTSRLEGQRDEPVGSALRAWPHGMGIVSPRNAKVSAWNRPSLTNDDVSVDPHSAPGTLGDGSNDGFRSLLKPVDGEVQRDESVGSAVRTKDHTGSLARA